MILKIVIPAESSTIVLDLAQVVFTPDIVGVDAVVLAFLDQLGFSVGIVQVVGVAAVGVFPDPRAIYAISLATSPPNIWR